MPARLPLLFAAAAGASGVAFGAFGAHALEGTLMPAQMETYQTAVLYHLIHALALGFTCALGTRASKWSAPCFAVGIVLFSGSLYALAFGAPKAFGYLTPVGGFAFIAGWLVLPFAGDGAPPQ